MYMRNFPPILLLLILGGCLPSSGPGTSAIVSNHGQAIEAFDVIPLDPAIADWVSLYQPEALASSFRTGRPAPDVTIGVGDTLGVTIFEAASGGLFTGESGSLLGAKSVSLPPQVVARDGTITIPYVGAVKAAGRTPAEMQAVTELALRDKAIEPQVIVVVAESASTFVTVTGEVVRPGQLPLNIGGDRILDVIAASGGTRAPDYDSFVRLTREGRAATVSLARLVRDPQQNIYLRPDDVLYVSTNPQTYTAFGATLANATLPFEADRLTLAEAVGRVGGLDDRRANPHGVFVFRYEDPEYHSAISARVIGDEPVDKTSAGVGVPVVYKLDLKDPKGFFTSQRFLMRDQDVIYVSNAFATDLEKFFGILRGGIATASGSVGLHEDVMN